MMADDEAFGRLPSPPRLPSIPAARADRPNEAAPPPIPGDLVLEIGDLKRALDGFVGSVNALSVRLSRYQLSLLEADHRAGVAIDLNRETARDVGTRFAALEDRVTALEKPQAAE